MRIKQTQTPQEIEQVRDLLREYEAFLDVDLCLQSFEAELASLPGKYVPPRGALLIAVSGGRAVECVALRDFHQTEPYYDNPLPGVVCWELELNKTGIDGRIAAEPDRTGEVPLTMD